MRHMHLLLTRQHRQQENVVGERNQTVRAQLVEDAVPLQRQLQTLRNGLCNRIDTPKDKC